jgi:hypothetical protein
MGAGESGAAPQLISGPMAPATDVSLSTALVINVTLGSIAWASPWGKSECWAEHQGPYSAPYIAQLGFSQLT